MNVGWFTRWRWALLALAVLLAGLAWSFWPEAAAVDLAKVTRGPMAIGVTDDGVTQAQDVYVVSAPVTGYMNRIELEPGDRVERGQLVTRMTGAPSSPLDQRSRAELRGALAAARAAEASASASLGQARRDLARAETLARDGFLSRARLEAARTAVATGEAALRQSRAEGQRIAAMLAEPSGQSAGAAIPVRAPAAGLVLTVASESEGVIREGATLMEIGDPGRIEVVVDLLSREAVKVKPGDPVEITQWGGDKPLAATVERIEPYGRLKISALGIEEQRVNVIARFDAASLPQAARLGHGYQIDATIVLWRKPDVLRVPIVALFRGADQRWRVFVADNGRARERKLTLGHIGDEFAEVLSGLSAGDAVVLNPGNMIADGARIEERQ